MTLFLQRQDLLVSPSFSHKHEDYGATHFETSNKKSDKS